MKTLVLVLAVLICSANAQESTVNNDATLVTRVLKDARNLETVPFSEVVESATGHHVIPVDRNLHDHTLTKLTAVIDQVVEKLGEPKHPIHAVGRINEASRFIEDELFAAFNRVPDWKCSIPETTGGAAQRSGYPDLLLETPDGAFYLDPKLYSQESESSSLRTFYYEPRVETNKIQSDAVHLLVGIMHTGWQNGKIGFTRWSLVDLATMQLRLKAEFQASNREIYSTGRTIASSASGDGIDKK